jgi:hypothetical protein
MTAEPPYGPPTPIAAPLDHVRRVATMLELIDRLPDLAEDIRVWRPRAAGETWSGEATAPLEPVARHAFGAVMNGLNMLGLAAATLCDNAQGRLTPDEVAACQEIGAAMSSLLERARALLDTGNASVFAAERARLFRSFLGEAARPPRLFGAS